MENGELKVVVYGEASLKEWTAIDGQITRGLKIGDVVEFDSEDFETLTVKVLSP